MGQTHARTVVVDLSVPSEAFDLGRVVGPPAGVRVDLVEFVPTGEGAIPYLWVEGDSEGVARFEHRVRGADRVADLRVVDAGGDRRLARVDWRRPPGEFLGACLAEDVLVQAGAGTGERWEFELRFLDSAALGEFQRSCADQGVPISVHRVTDPESADGDGYGLTGPQREALLLAFEEGYFDAPRGATLTELGERLGITRQAVSYRLRAGTERLLAATLATGHGD
jgi:predicted DNA binding protein